MNAEEHRAEDFLIKAFARHVDLPRIIILFKEQFGRSPTEAELAKCNLGEFIGDRRAVFDPKNSRMRKFLKERELFEKSKDNNPIFSTAWRGEQYLKIYRRVEPEAMATGNVSRLLDILTMAAKDQMGGHRPAVHIDNRTINMNMTDQEVNKKIRGYLDDLGLSDKNLDIPMIEKGDNVIDLDPD